MRTEYISEPLSKVGRGIIDPFPPSRRVSSQIKNIFGRISTLIWGAPPLFIEDAHGPIAWFFLLQTVPRITRTKQWKRPQILPYQWSLWLQIFQHQSFVDHEWGSHFGGKAVIIVPWRHDSHMTHQDLQDRSKKTCHTLLTLRPTYG